eukprot:346052-Rhodomonas_salina.1
MRQQRLGTLSPRRRIVTPKKHWQQPREAPGRAHNLKEAQRRRRRGEEEEEGGGKERGVGGGVESRTCHCLLESRTCHCLLESRTCHCLLPHV